MNTTLHVKNKIVVSIWVIYPHDHVAGRELWLTPATQHPEGASYGMVLAWEKLKIQNSEYFPFEYVWHLHHHEVKSVVSQAIASWGSSILCNKVWILFK